MNGFLLVDHQIPDAASIDKNGNRFLSGNGHLGLRGTLSEYTKAQKPAIIINGLYDKVGDSWREPVNAPNGMFFQISVGEAPLEVTSASVSSHEHGINFRHGIQQRKTTFTLAEGQLVLESRRFVSATHERLICAEYVVTAQAAMQVTISSGIDADVWDINGPHLENIHLVSGEAQEIALSGVTSESKTPLSVAEYCQSPSRELATMSVAQRKSTELSFCRSFSLSLEAGQSVRFEKFYVVYDGERARTKSAALDVAAFGKRGFESLRAEHVAAWEQRWLFGDVQIEGDEEAAEALRFSLYHLQAIAPVFSDSLSIPARGLSGQVYKGAIFWDTEMFMLPYFLVTAPKVARTLAKYRVSTLEGAKRKAREYGHDGAFYAWESQDSGDDACTLFNVNDVFTGRPMRTFFRDKQIHISADIAHALFEYTEVSGDTTLLLDGGAEAIFECARFLASWLYHKPSKDRFEALDVTGPDEYHECVHNDYFTNVMVKRTFSIARKTNALLEQLNPAQRQALLKKIGFSEFELASFSELEAKLYVAEPDSQTGVIPQFDGYLSLEDVSLEQLNARKLHKNEYFGGGNGLARWTQIIKQADVVLALAMFSEDYTKDIIAKNWEFYEPRTEHGSSLSACAYSIAASAMGKTEEAYRYFMKTATIDITGLSKQYVGDLYIGGTHPAANGGAWLAVVRGMCGVQVRGAAIHINPSLPKQFKSVSFSLIANERALKLVVSSGQVTAVCEQDGASVDIFVGGQKTVLSSTAPVTIHL